MLIRRETPEDVDAISAVTTAAFRRRADAPEPPETALLSRLRADVGWLPALSLVAVTDDAVIGHVVLHSRVVDNTPALAWADQRPARPPGRRRRARAHAFGARRGGRERRAACGAARRSRVLSALRLRCRLEAWDRRARHGLGRPLPSACAEFGPTGLTGTFRYASPFAEL